MEGNECYKFSTIQNFISQCGVEPIRLTVDVGCNLGHVTAMMRRYFPASFAFCFEPVKDYYEQACRNLVADTMVKVFPVAVTAEHMFADDLGKHRLDQEVPLQIFRALPASGMGWVGGSHVLPPGKRPEKQIGYERAADSVIAITLDELVQSVCGLMGRQQVDYVKMDCEGCENSALGCASVETLERIRFISGEYHNISRFRHVMEGNLSLTHRVNLVGENAGSFFAERKTNVKSILRPDQKTGMRVQSANEDYRVEWHVFDDEFVLPSERHFHGPGN